MKLTNIVLSAALALGISFGSGCMPNSEIESDGKINGERVTSTYKSGGFECPLTFWREINVRKSDGSNLFFLDEGPNNDLDYFQRDGPRGNMTKSAGVFAHDCLIFVGNPQTVSEQQQKLFEKYRIAANVVYIDQ